MTCRGYYIIISPDIVTEVVTYNVHAMQRSLKQTSIYNCRLLRVLNEYYFPGVP